MTCKGCRCVCLVITIVTPRKSNETRTRYESYGPIINSIVLMGLPSVLDPISIVATGRVASSWIYHLNLFSLFVDLRWTRNGLGLLLFSEPDLNLFFLRSTTTTSVRKGISAVKGRSGGGKREGRCSGACSGRRRLGERREERTVARRRHVLVVGRREEEADEERSRVAVGLLSATTRRLGERGWW